MGIAIKLVLLAAAWVTVTGSLTLPNTVLGLIVGLTGLYLVREHLGRVRGRRHRPLRILALAILFVRELILSAWRVTTLVTSPRMDLKPGIFAYPLKADRDFEIALLANLITLTPGTLSVDVSEDRQFLYIHAIDCSDPAATMREIEMGFERKILEAFR